MCARVCVCACVCARARVCVCVSGDEGEVSQVEGGSGGPGVGNAQMCADPDQRYVNTQGRYQRQGGTARWGAGGQVRWEE